MVQARDACVRAGASNFLCIAHNSLLRPNAASFCSSHGTVATDCWSSTRTPGRPRYCWFSAVSLVGCGAAIPFGLADPGRLRSRITSDGALANHGLARGKRRPQTVASAACVHLLVADVPVMESEEQAQLRRVAGKLSWKAGGPRLPG